MLCKNEAPKGRQAGGHDGGGGAPVPLGLASPCCVVCRKSAGLPWPVSVRRAAGQSCRAGVCSDWPLRDVSCLSWSAVYRYGIPAWKREKDEVVVILVRKGEDGTLLLLLLLLLPPSTSALLTPR